MIWPLWMVWERVLSSCSCPQHPDFISSFWGFAELSLLSWIRAALTLLGFEMPSIFYLQGLNFSYLGEAFVSCSVLDLCTYWWHCKLSWCSGFVPRTPTTYQLFPSHSPCPSVSKSRKLLSFRSWSAYLCFSLLRFNGSILWVFSTPASGIKLCSCPCWDPKKCWTCLQQRVGMLY